MRNLCSLSLKNLILAATVVVGVGVAMSVVSAQSLQTANCPIRTVKKGFVFGGSTYRLTTEIFDPTDSLQSKIHEQYGAATEIADWDELKGLLTDNDVLKAFLENPGIPSQTHKYSCDNILVNHAGESTLQGMHYLFARHDGKKPYDWAILDNIGQNILNLGRWNHPGRVLIKTSTQTAAAAQGLEEGARLNQQALQIAQQGRYTGSERRVALVIGNDVYRNLSDNEQLHNAVNDARAVKATLEGLGFEVIAGENLNRASLVERLSDFGARLQRGDIAFFFYAGHGVSLNGANYILPSDVSAPLSTGRDEEERLADLAVAETRVIDRIKRADARVAVVVLDACRDNPLALPGGRSIGAARGLAPPPETRGVLSIYSAGVGQQALDRLNDADGTSNSVFTRVFVRKLKTPGLSLRAAAFETQEEVASLAASSGHEQVPGVYSQILGDVYLAGGAAPAPAELSGDTQQAEFAAAMQQRTLSALDAFISKYSTSSLAEIARRERDGLAKEESSQQVVSVAPEDRQQPVRYFFVWDTRPPDDWLALRSEPTTKRGRQIRKMENGTLLDVIDKRTDGWWRVRVVDTGEVGWALSGQGSRTWIDCCRSH